jgi:hypothetical protein
MSIDVMGKARVDSSDRKTRSARKEHFCYGIDEGGFAAKEYGEARRCRRIPCSQPPIEETGNRDEEE